MPFYFSIIISLLLVITDNQWSNKVVGLKLILDKGINLEFKIKLYLCQYWTKN